MFKWSKLNFILMKNCVKSNILGVLCFYHSHLVCYKCKIPCNYYTFLFTKKEFYAVFFFFAQWILFCVLNWLIFHTSMWPKWKWFWKYINNVNFNLKFFEFVALHDKGTKGLLHKCWAIGNTWAGWAYYGSNPANGLALFDQGIEIWPRL